jgi:hypothetical protein
MDAHERPIRRLSAHTGLGADELARDEAREGARPEWFA